MTEDEANQLRQEKTALKEALVQKDQRIEELERRQAKDSHNRSKTPSSDVLGRKKSGKASGGQSCHQGHTMLQAAEPDQMLIHRPGQCEQCQRDLSEVAGQTKERRQMHEIPPLHLVVPEHQVEVIARPDCGHQSTGTFPVGMDAPIQ